MWSSRLAWLGAVLVCRGLRRLRASLADGLARRLVHGLVHGFAHGLVRFMVGRRVGHAVLAVAGSRRCTGGRKLPGARGGTFTCTATPAAPTTPSTASAAAAFGTLRAPFSGWPRAGVRTGELRTRCLGRSVALALAVVAIDGALADSLAAALTDSLAAALTGAFDTALTCAFATALASTLGRWLVPPAAVAIAIAVAVIAPALPVASVAATVALAAGTVRVTAMSGMLTAAVAPLALIAPWSASRARSTRLRRRLGCLRGRRLASEHPLEA
jgi:hypothetical protein